MNVEEEGGRANKTKAAEVVSWCGVNERSPGPHLTQREGVMPRNI